MNPQTSQSLALYTRAQKILPGGVNSPVRAFYGVGGTPVFMDRGEGAYVYDVDQHRYIDYVLSWGPLILGHAHPVLLKAIEETARKGTSFGTPTFLEIEIAQTIQRLMPHMEMIRMVNSGTEAGLAVIRLARGYTGRNKILKFEGCYHGHADSLLVKAGSGAQTFGQPSSAGVPIELAQHTLIARYNDLEQVTNLFEKYGKEIAAIIVEPVAGNMNCILPQPGFLEGLRSLCDTYQSVLIFDEVMTGFRVALGGAAAYFNITPDLTMLGKVIGGGLPAAAYGGKKDIMECVAPLGPVYQAGTLSGNPLAMAAGLATLKEIQAPQFFETLSLQAKNLCEGFKRLAAEQGIAIQTTQAGGLFGFFFTENTSLCNLQDVEKANLPLFKQFYQLALEEGLYFAPSMFEANFISSAHSSNIIAQTLAALEKVLKKIAA